MKNVRMKRYFVVIMKMPKEWVYLTRHGYKKLQDTEKLETLNLLFKKQVFYKTKKIFISTISWQSPSPQECIQDSLMNLQNTAPLMEEKNFLKIILTITPMIFQ